MNGSAIYNGIAQTVKRLTSSIEPFARPTAMFLAGRLGGGAAVQFGPWAVKTVVNHTTSGYFARFLYQQSLNAALGSYYYPAGQMLFSGIAAVCPGPKVVAREIRAHYQHHYQQKRYLAELDKSDFDPTRLTVEEVNLEGVKEGFLNYTYQSLPVDESSYCIFKEEDADGLPRQLPLPANGKPEFEMETFSADNKTDASGVNETAL